MRAALRAIRARRPAALVLAVPVAPPDTLDALKAEVDETVCLEVHAAFGAIGYFYADFHQLDDDEVIAILDRFKPDRTRQRRGELSARGDPSRLATLLAIKGLATIRAFKR